MQNSDEFGFDVDETEFIAIATQVEASQSGDRDSSQQPTKRRRVRRDPGRIGGELYNECRRIYGNGASPRAQQKSSLNQSSQNSAEEDASKEPETDDEYYFPREFRRADQTAQRNSRYKIVVPRNGGQFPDQIFTQTQPGLDSSPSTFRGAVWKKPKPPATISPPAFNLSSGSVRPCLMESEIDSIQLGQTSLNSLHSNILADPTADDEKLAARLQAEEDAHMRHQYIADEPDAAKQQAFNLDMQNELADIPSDAFNSSPEKPFAEAVVEISSQPTTSQQEPQRLRGPQTGLKQMTIFGQLASQELPASQIAKKRYAWPLKAREEPPTHHKLDKAALETWVYPTNLGTIRDYQYNIVSRSLYHNTLVALPTGLGKTFIAATVMLNYYRWTTEAQIIFMAPTKPLIAQQMDACYHIVGIPRRDTALMTGETTPAVRADEWLDKRVFFMTPHTVINDLKSGICDPKKIVLVVVDEAHKATGSYAYTEVVAFLRRFNNSFRVLALTATPGSTVEGVQSVIDHLGIVRVELRTEQSLDIRPYTHEKETEKELFDYSDEQVMIMNHISKVIQPQLDKLTVQNAYWSRDPMQLTAYGLTISRKKWAQSDAGKKAPMPVKGMINAAFTVLSQLAHSISLLKNHGIGPFYTGMLDFKRAVETGQSKSKTAQAIVQHEEFSKMMDRIRGWTNNPDFIGHPKLQYLRELVLNHFLDAGEGAKGSKVPPSATRVMVFASYRDSTEEIVRVLRRDEPMIRPHVFVGQAAGSNTEGMNQKKQNQVVQEFKSGKYNTLVATCIGEEGLDIGDVDLIVCYDASSSPIRMLQRIGRTGRKRLGRVALLLMKGKEENDYAKAQDNYSYIQKTIADANKYSYRDNESPRILPKDVNPVVDKRIIQIPIENSNPIDLNEKGRRAKAKCKKKRPPKKFHMPSGVRPGFTIASKLAMSDNEDIDSGFRAPEERTKAKKRKPAKELDCLSALEIAPTPLLEEVILREGQHSQLERKYAYIPDGVDNIVHGPDFTRFPTAIGDLGATTYIGHSCAAQAVAKAMQSLKGIDISRIQRMKDSLDWKILDDAESARARLVSPLVDHNKSEEKTQPLRPSPARIAKNTFGRHRGMKTIEPTASYDLTAMEGSESEPDPTPADLQLGTQGIDLGSRDTSGSEHDEEPDSELDSFIAKSDEIIQTISSSLPNCQNEVRTSVRARKRMGLSKRPALSLNNRFSAASIVTDAESDSGTSVRLEECDAIAKQAAPCFRRKNKRTILESDSD